MGLVLNGVMEFLVKPLFSVVMRTENTQTFLSNTRRILPHSAMLLVTHKTTLTVSLTQQWKKLGRRTQIYKGSFFHSSLTWDSHGRISFLTTACLEYWEFLCGERACGFRKLVHFWPFLPCLCCPQPPHSLPNHEYIGCVTAWNNITTVSTHDKAKIDLKLPRTREESGWSHEGKKKKKTFHSSLWRILEKNCTVEITCHQCVKQLDFKGKCLL